ncbi:TIGR03982 family His-Xaa-Ser system protein [Minwuia sp. IMCC3009]|uniref:TIGR03982 family His-Xaa-Ser system protein n=1 Tax=Minwuia sp. IMCC3009 TaxID=3040674 RepID=UPI00247A30AD|nr:TIGR03982 family His-Xaa-Ser system protein [Minwuia sp. IMCC3009]
MTRFLLSGIFGLVILYGGIEYLLPPVAAHYLRDEYQGAMFQCDHVMREHFVAKMAVRHAPNEMTVKNLEAAEIGLLSCQDYDKLRKKLLTLGVSDAKLGLMGVEALEARSKDVSRFVEIHEIRY